MDALAQMMSQGNVRAGARLLVVDDCSGLLVAACLERLGGVRRALKRRVGIGDSRTGTRCVGHA